MEELLFLGCPGSSGSAPCLSGASGTKTIDVQVDIGRLEFAETAALKNVVNFGVFDFADLSTLAAHEMVVARQSCDFLVLGCLGGKSVTAHKTTCPQKLDGVVDRGLAYVVAIFFERIVERLD